MKHRPINSYGPQSIGDLLNGGASEHKTKRIVKDKNQLQEQLTYLGSGFNREFSDTLPLP